MVNVRQPFGFYLQFDARVQSLEILRLLVIYLWRLFRTVSKKTFISKPQAIVMASCPDVDKPVINDNNYDIWLHRKTDEYSQSRYKCFLEAVRPDLSEQQIDEMIKDFISSEDNNNKNLQENMHINEDYI